MKRPQDMMTLTTRLTRALPRITRNENAPQVMLIALWVLLMIALPILRWTYGEDIIPAAASAALLAQFAAVFTITGKGLGWRQTLSIFSIVAVATWAVEFTGSSTGVPFGEYSYTDTLQPQIAHVPVIIPLAWFMMLLPSWAVAQIITKDHLLPYIIVSGVAITTWDLFLDPQMVEWRFWKWTVDGAYFGIPLSNYAGWLLTGVVVTLLIRPYRYDLPISPLLMIYGVVWFLQTVGQAVFWAQPGPALTGGVMMGTILTLAVYRARAEAQYDTG